MKRGSNEAGVGERLHLEDGRTALIRDLTVADEAALRRAYTSADPAILRSRFGGAAPRLDVLVAKLHEMNGITRYGAGAFDEAGELIGVAQYAQPTPDGPADVAVVVVPTWQRHGVGTALLHLLAVRAAAAGIHAVTALVSGSNARVLELIEDLPVQHRVDFEDGSGTLQVDLSPLDGGDPDGTIGPSASRPGRHAGRGPTAVRRPGHPSLQADPPEDDHGEQQDDRAQADRAQAERP